MRIARGSFLLGVLLALGCGASDSPGAVGIEPRTLTVALGVARADVPSGFVLSIEKPLLPPATLEIAGPIVGPFEPVDGELPAAVPEGLLTTLRVLFTPDGSGAVGEMRGTIPLRFVSADGKVSFPVTIDLAATVERPSVRVPVTFVNAGPVAVGETVELTAALENTSLATPVRVLSVTPPSGEFSIGPAAPALPLDLAPGARLAIPVRYSPTSLDTASSSVEFHSAIPTGPLAVDFRGNGIPAQIVTEVGSVPVDPFTGETDWITVAVPPLAVSLFFEAWSDHPDALIDLIGLEGPGGRVFETYDLTGPFLWTLNYPAGGRGYLNLELPNTDLPAVQLVTGGGDYRFRLRDRNLVAGSIDVRATVQQRAGAMVREGTLDLNLFLADGIYIEDPANPLADAKLAATLRNADAILGESGVRIGRIEVRFLDPSYDVLGDADSLEAMVAANTASLEEGSLNLFFVREITYGPAGIAGAVPGPVENGTPWSGVVIAYNRSLPPLLGATTAHEIGHYLGHVDPGAEEEQVLLEPDESFAVLRHPLVGPGLPDVILAPPETLSVASLLAEIGPLAPMIDWCGSCQRPPAR